MTQAEWEEAVVDCLDDWGLHPDIIEEVRLRMDKGANSGRGLPPDELDFLQDRLEEAMDGFCYCVGDLVERELNLREDPELKAWKGLLGYLAAKRTVRRQQA
jgi:hypothetical protein